MKTGLIYSAFLISIIFYDYSDGKLSDTKNVTKLYNNNAVSKKVVKDMGTMELKSKIIENTSTNRYNYTIGNNGSKIEIFKNNSHIKNNVTITNKTQNSLQSRTKHQQISSKVAKQRLKEKLQERKKVRTNTTSEQSLDLRSSTQSIARKKYNIKLRKKQKLSTKFRNNDSSLSEKTEKLTENDLVTTPVTLNSTLQNKIYNTSHIIEPKSISHSKTIYSKKKNGSLMNKRSNFHSKRINPESALESTFEETFNEKEKSVSDFLNLEMEETAKIHSESNPSNADLISRGKRNINYDEKVDSSRISGNLLKVKDVNKVNFKEKSDDNENLNYAYDYYVIPESLLEKTDGEKVTADDFIPSNADIPSKVKERSVKKQLIKDLNNIEIVQKKIMLPEHDLEFDDDSSLINEKKNMNNYINKRSIKKELITKEKDSKINEINFKSSLKSRFYPEFYINYLKKSSLLVTYKPEIKDLLTPTSKFESSSASPISTTIIPNILTDSKKSFKRDTIFTRYNFNGEYTKRYIRQINSPTTFPPNLNSISTKSSEKSFKNTTNNISNLNSDKNTSNFRNIRFVLDRSNSSIKNKKLESNNTVTESIVSSLLKFETNSKRTTVNKSPELLHKSSNPYKKSAQWQSENKTSSQLNVLEESKSSAIESWNKSELERYGLKLLTTEEFMQKLREKDKTLDSIIEKSKGASQKSSNFRESLYENLDTIVEMSKIFSTTDIDTWIMASKRRWKNSTGHSKYSDFNIFYPENGVSISPSVLRTAISKVNVTNEYEQKLDEIIEEAGSDKYNDVESWIAAVKKRLNFSNFAKNPYKNFSQWFKTPSPNSHDLYDDHKHYVKISSDNNSQWINISSGNISDWKQRYMQPMPTFPSNITKRISTQNNPTYTKTVKSNELDDVKPLVRTNGNQWSSLNLNENKNINQNYSADNDHPSLNYPSNLNSSFDQYRFVRNTYKEFKTDKIFEKTSNKTLSKNKNWVNFKDIPVTLSYAANNIDKIIYTRNVYEDNLYAIIEEAKSNNHSDVNSWIEAAKRRGLNLSKPLKKHEKYFQDLNQFKDENVDKNFSTPLKYYEQILDTQRKVITPINSTSQNESSQGEGLYMSNPATPKYNIPNIFANSISDVHELNLSTYFTELQNNLTKKFKLKTPITSLSQFVHTNNKIDNTKSNNKNQNVKKTKDENTSDKNIEHGDIKHNKNAEGVVVNNSDINSIEIGELITEEELLKVFSINETEMRNSVLKILKNKGINITNSIRDLLRLRLAELVDAIQSKSEKERNASRNTYKRSNINNSRLKRNINAYEKLDKSSVRKIIHRKLRKKRANIIISHRPAETHEKNNYIIPEYLLETTISEVDNSTKKKRSLINDLKKEKNSRKSRPRRSKMLKRLKRAIKLDDKSLSESNLESSDGDMVSSIEASKNHTSFDMNTSASDETENFLTESETKKNVNNLEFSEGEKEREYLSNENVMSNIAFRDDKYKRHVNPLDNVTRNTTFVSVENSLGNSKTESDDDKLTIESFPLKIPVLNETTLEMISSESKKFKNTIDFKVPKTNLNSKIYNDTQERSFEHFPKLNSSYFTDSNKRMMKPFTKTGDEILNPMRPDIDETVFENSISTVNNESRNDYFKKKNKFQNFRTNLKNNTFDTNNSNSFILNNNTILSNKNSHIRKTICNCCKSTQTTEINESYEESKLPENEHNNFAHSKCLKKMLDFSEALSGIAKKENVLIFENISSDILLEENFEDKRNISSTDILNINNTLNFLNDSGIPNMANESKEKSRINKRFLNFKNDKNKFISNGVNGRDLQNSVEDGNCDGINCKKETETNVEDQYDNRYKKKKYSNVSVLKISYQKGKQDSEVSKTLNISYTNNYKPTNQKSNEDESALKNSESVSKLHPTFTQREYDEDKDKFNKYRPSRIPSKNRLEKEIRTTSDNLMDESKSLQSNEGQSDENIFKRSVDQQIEVIDRIKDFVENSNKTEIFSHLNSSLITDSGENNSNDENIKNSLKYEHLKEESEFSRNDHELKVINASYQQFENFTNIIYTIFQENYFGTRQLNSTQNRYYKVLNRYENKIEISVNLTAIEELIKKLTRYIQAKLKEFELNEKAIPDKIRKFTKSIKKLLWNVIELDDITTEVANRSQHSLNSYKNVLYSIGKKIRSIAKELHENVWHDDSNSTKMMENEEAEINKSINIQISPKEEQRVTEDEDNKEVEMKNFTDFQKNERGVSTEKSYSEYSLHVSDKDKKHRVFTELLQMEESKGKSIVENITKNIHKKEEYVEMKAYDLEKTEPEETRSFESIKNDNYVQVNLKPTEKTTQMGVIKTYKGTIYPIVNNEKEPVIQNNIKEDQQSTRYYELENSETETDKSNLNQSGELEEYNISKTTNLRKIRQINKTDLNISKNENISKDIKSYYHKEINNSKHNALKEDHKHMRELELEKSNTEDEEFMNLKEKLNKNISNSKVSIKTHLITFYNMKKIDKFPVSRKNPDINNKNKKQLVHKHIDNNTKIIKLDEKPMNINTTEDAYNKVIHKKENITDDLILKNPKKLEKENLSEKLKYIQKHLVDKNKNKKLRYKRKHSMFDLQETNLEESKTEDQESKEDLEPESSESSRKLNDLDKNEENYSKEKINEIEISAEFQNNDEVNNKNKDLYKSNFISNDLQRKESDYDGIIENNSHETGSESISNRKDNDEESIFDASSNKDRHIVSASKDNILFVKNIYTRNDDDELLKRNFDEYPDQVYDDEDEVPRRRKNSRSKNSRTKISRNELRDLKSADDEPFMRVYPVDLLDKSLDRFSDKYGDSSESFIDNEIENKNGYLTIRLKNESNRKYPNINEENSAMNIYSDGFKKYPKNKVINYLSKHKEKDADVEENLNDVNDLEDDNRYNKVESGEEKNRIVPHNKVKSKNKEKINSEEAEDESYMKIYPLESEDDKEYNMNNMDQKPHFVFKMLKKREGHKRSVNTQEKQLNLKEENAQYSKNLKKRRVRFEDNKYNQYLSKDKEYIADNLLNKKNHIKNIPEKVKTTEPYNFDNENRFLSRKFFYEVSDSTSNLLPNISNETEIEKINHKKRLDYIKKRLMATNKDFEKKYNKENTYNSFKELVKKNKDYNKQLKSENYKRSISYDHYVPNAEDEIFNDTKLNTTEVKSIDFKIDEIKKINVSLNKTAEKLSDVDQTANMIENEKKIEAHKFSNLNNLTNDDHENQKEFHDNTFLRDATNVSNQKTNKSKYDDVEMKNLTNDGYEHQKKVQDDKFLLSAINISNTKTNISKYNDVEMNNLTNDDHEYQREFHDDSFLLSAINISNKKKNKSDYDDIKVTNLTNVDYEYQNEYHDDNFLPSAINISNKNTNKSEHVEIKNLTNHVEIKKLNENNKKWKNNKLKIEKYLEEKINLSSLNYNINHNSNDINNVKNDEVKNKFHENNNDIKDGIDKFREQLNETITGQNNISIMNKYNKTIDLKSKEANNLSSHHKYLVLSKLKGQLHKKVKNVENNSSSIEKSSIRKQEKDSYKNPLETFKEKNREIPINNDENDESDEIIIKVKEESDEILSSEKGEEYIEQTEMPTTLSFTANLYDTTESFIKSLQKSIQSITNGKSKSKNLEIDRTFERSFTVLKINNSCTKQTCVGSWIYMDWIITSYTCAKCLSQKYIDRLAEHKKSKSTFKRIDYTILHPSYSTYFEECAGLDNERKDYVLHNFSFNDLGLIKIRDNYDLISYPIVYPELSQDFITTKNMECTTITSGNSSDNKLIFYTYDCKQLLNLYNNCHIVVPDICEKYVITWTKNDTNIPSGSPLICKGQLYAIYSMTTLQTKVKYDLWTRPQNDWIDEILDEYNKDNLMPNYLSDIKKSMGLQKPIHDSLIVDTASRTDKYGTRTIIRNVGNVNDHDKFFRSVSDHLKFKIYILFIYCIVHFVLS